MNYTNIKIFYKGLFVHLLNILQANTFWVALVIEEIHYIFHHFHNTSLVTQISCLLQVLFFPRSRKCGHVCTTTIKKLQYKQYVKSSLLIYDLRFKTHFRNLCCGVPI